MKLFGSASLAAGLIVGTAAAAHAGWGCGCPAWYYGPYYYYAPPTYAAPAAPAPATPAPAATTPAAPPTAAAPAQPGQTFRNFSYEPGESPDTGTATAPAAPSLQRPARAASSTPRVRSYRPSYLRGGSKMMGRFGQ